jgi:hypothetical protein
VIDEVTAELLGVWSLVEVLDRDDESAAWHPYGPHPAGVIVYDASGTLSVHLIADGSIPSSDGYLGYWGTFRVATARLDGEAFVGALEHHIEGASMPELLAEGPERLFRLAGDTLRISDEQTYRRDLVRVSPQNREAATH